MAWRFDKPEHRIFPRNPLVATVVELRYHPILKIGVTQGVPTFQDRIRQEFPEYSEVKRQIVKVQPSSGTVEIRDENQFRFIKEDKSTTLTLGSSSLVLECKNHQSHADTREDMGLAIDALTEVFSPIKPTRLGIRYINVIDREEIGALLKNDVQWEELINAEFLRTPKDIADLEDTVFGMEIDSSIDDNGRMTLRYGIQQETPEKPFNFRFDIDRYLEQSFLIEGTDELIKTFALDIYALYMNMVGPKLKEWMEVAVDTAESK